MSRPEHEERERPVTGCAISAVVLALAVALAVAGCAGWIWWIS